MTIYLKKLKILKKHKGINYFIHEKRFKYIEVRLLLIFLFKFDLIAKFYKKLEYKPITIKDTNIKQIPMTALN